MNFSSWNYMYDYHTHTGTELLPDRYHKKAGHTGYILIYNSSTVWILRPG
jgi:hypothetical protein